VDAVRSPFRITYFCGMSIRCCSKQSVLPLLLLVVLYLHSMPVAARAHADSVLRSVTAQKVLITRSRDSSDYLRTITDVYHVNYAAIRAKAPYQLQDILSDVGGLFVKQYGGPGSMSTISVRGGSAAQALVLFDGMRLNTVQNGGVDISTIPISFIRSVDVRKGALGSTAGANAMTGTVELTVAIPDNPVRLEAGAGSFETWRTLLQGAVRGTEWKAGAGLEAYSSAGSYNYPFFLHNEQMYLTRDNARVRTLSGIVRIEGPRNLAVTLVAQTTKRGVPGAVVPDVAVESVASLINSDILGQAKLQLFKNGGWQVNTGVALRYLNARYTDALATFVGPQGIKAHYTSVETVADVQALLIKNDIIHEARVSAGTALLTDTQLQPELGGMASRHQGAAAYRFSASLPHMEVEASLRGEWYSDVPGAVAAGAGLAWLPDTNLAVRLHVGSGYRPPSFNELYLFNYGNRELLPERSTAVTTGVRWQPVWWLWADASAYGTLFSDLIVSIPLSPVLTSAFNVGRATGVGAEYSIGCTIPGTGLSLQCNYNVQDMRDHTGRPGVDGTPIPYVPVEAVHGVVSWDGADVFARGEWSYTGYRYAQAGGDVLNVLPSYHLATVVVGTRYSGDSLKGSVQLRCDNILDTRYQVVRGYPMPGRSARIVLEVLP